MGGPIPSPQTPYPYMTSLRSVRPVWMAGGRTKAEGRKPDTLAGLAKQLERVNLKNRQDAPQSRRRHFVMKCTTCTIHLMILDQSARKFDLRSF